MTADMHAILQAPLVLVIMMAGIIMIYRGRATINGDISASPALQFSIALMLCALALKQMFWQIFWALKATDALRTSNVVLDATWIATALNILVIMIGAVVCVLASSPLMGPSKSTTLVVSVLVAVTAASAIMVSA